MICPDCEMEVNRLCDSTGTCVPCYKRWQNMKYKKLEYVPLKDIKGSIEYNRAMGRRLAALKRHSNSESNDEVKTEGAKTPKTKTESAKEYIEKKIDDLISINNLDISLIDIESVKLTLNLMKDLFCDFEVKKSELSKAISLIDLLKCDVQHEIESCDINNEEDYKYINDKNYYLLKKRRVFKNSYNILDKLSNISYSINSLVGFKAMIEDNIKMIEELKNQQEHPLYNVKVDDGMLKYNFTREDMRHKYQVRVILTGLYNSRKPTEFTRNVLANNKDEAKNIVRQFIQDKFKGVRMGDTVVEELSLSSDKVSNE